MKIMRRREGGNLIESVENTRLTDQFDSMSIRAEPEHPFPSPVLLSRFDFVNMSVN